MIHYVGDPPISERFVADEDRVSWGPGPWQVEDDRMLWRCGVTGYLCLMVRGSSGAWCGYVGLLPGHRFHGIFHEDVPVEVHGGLTYGEKCHGRVCHTPNAGEPDNVWWLGFDCAHLGDFMPRIAMHVRELGANSFNDGTYRDADWVANEVVNLAVQLKEAKQCPS